MHKIFESTPSSRIGSSGPEDLNTRNYNDLRKKIDISNNTTFKIDVDFVNSLSSIVPEHSSLAILTELEGSAPEELIENPAFLSSLLNEMLNYKLRNPNSSLVLPDTIDFNNIIENDFTNTDIRNLLLLLIKDLKSTAKILRTNRLYGTETATFQTTSDILDRFGLIPEVAKQKLKEVNNTIMNSENPIATAVGLNLFFKYVAPKLLPDKLRAAISPFEKAVTVYTKYSLALIAGDAITPYFFPGSNLTQMIKGILPKSDTQNQFTRNLEFRLNSNLEAEAFVLSFTPQQACGGIIDPVFSGLTFKDALDPNKFPSFAEFQAKSPYYGKDVKRYNTARKLFTQLKKALDNKAKLDPEGFGKLYKKLLRDNTVKWPSGFLSLISGSERLNESSNNAESLVKQHEKPLEPIDKITPTLKFTSEIPKLRVKGVFDNKDHVIDLTQAYDRHKAVKRGTAEDQKAKETHNAEIDISLNMNLTDFESNPFSLNPNYGHLFKKALDLSHRKKPFVSSIGIEYYAQKFSGYNTNNLQKALTDVVSMIQTNHPRISSKDIRENLNLVFGGGDGNTRQYFGFTFNPPSSIASQLQGLDDSAFEDIQISNFNPNLSDGLNQPILSLNYRQRYSANIDKLDEISYSDKAQTRKRQVLAELEKIVTGSPLRLPASSPLKLGKVESGQITPALEEIYDKFQRQIATAKTDQEKENLFRLQNRMLLYIALKASAYKATNAASGGLSSALEFLTSVKDEITSSIESHGVLGSIPAIIQSTAEHFKGGDPALAYAKHFDDQVNRILTDSTLSDSDIDTTAFKQDTLYIKHLYALCISDFLLDRKKSVATNAVNKILTSYGLKPPSRSSNTYTLDLANTFDDLIKNKLLPAFAAQIA